jgi:hypothetical protein
MSRIHRYQDSFKNYIKDRSAIKPILEDKDVKYYFDKYHNDSEYLLPILLLTILNGQNKKNNISFHSYQLASGIEFLYIVINIINYEELNFKTCRVINILLSLVTKSISYNIITINKKIKPDKVNNICIEILKTLDEYIGYNGIFSNIDIKYDKKCQNDIKFYFKNHQDIKLYDSIQNKKFIKPLTMNQIVEKRLGSICQLAIKLVWIIGNGSNNVKDKELKRISKIGLAFAKMLQISNNCQTLNYDILNEKNISYNYILNCGFSLSYEEFLKNKQEFIEECLNLNILSATVKEILDSIDEKVDLMINSTSHDLRSSYSSIQL